MASLNIRIEDNLKNDVENILNQLGLTSSDAVRIFFHQVRQNRGIPFGLYIQDEPTPATEQIIAQAEQDLKAGNVSKEYTNSDELLSDLIGA